MSLTFDSAMDDAVDLLRKWVAVIRTTVEDIAKFEKEHPERSKRDKTASRWQMYLGTMTVKAAEGVADLARSRNVRAMTILMRSIYEYQVKAQFFLKHPKEAREQFLSIPARRYVALTKMARITPNSGPLLAAEYLKWKRTSGKRDEWSGEVKFTNMHLKNTDPSNVKTDKDGKPYTQEFVTLYGTASWYVHGAPPLFPEVFPHLDDEADWDATEDYTYFDALSVMGAVNASLSKFVLEACKAYGFGPDRMKPLTEQVERTLSAVDRLHRERDKTGPNTP